MSVHGGSTNGGGGVGGGFTPSPGALTIINGKLGKANPVFEKTKSIAYESGTSQMVMSFGRTDSSTALQDVEPKRVDITNTGTVPLYTIVVYNMYAGDATDTGAIWVHTILLAGESFSPPIRTVGRVTGSGAADELSPLEGTSIDWTAPNANAYVASATALIAEDLDDSETDIVVDDGSAGSVQNMFKVGDLIRINNEVMRVTAITDTDTDGGYTPMSLTVERGLYGSIKATHTNNDPIRFPFFNTYGDFDGSNILATDVQGRWWSMNFFGLGRVALALPSGITPGTFCMRFYSQGYQELGLSGITSSTNSGLAVSTTYGFDITVDGSGNMNSGEMQFTTGSNVNFGGTDGVISKIQSVFDARYYVADSDIFQEKVTIGIVNGDIRFTSGQRLEASAILLAAPTGGQTTPFGVGRFPAIGSVQAPVAARLPDDSIYDPITYNASPNISQFAYDLGDGTIVGAATGKINYETGELLLRNAPPLADFEYSVAHTGALSGKLNSDDTSRINSILYIHANTLNRKMSSKINIKVY